jgi:hypothetical protein
VGFCVQQGNRGQELGFEAVQLGGKAAWAWEGLGGEVVLGGA